MPERHSRVRLRAEQCVRMRPPELPRRFPFQHLETWTDAQWRTIPATNVPITTLIPSQEAVSLEALARLVNADPRCKHCGHAIETAPTSTGWTHGNGWEPGWQGVRCPRRLTGAEPAPSEPGRAIRWQGELHLYDGHTRWVRDLLTGQAMFPVRIVEMP